MKLSLANRIPRDYNAATFQEIVRFLEEQSNLHAEGKLRARHGALTAAPTIGNWEKGDFVWNSNPSVSSNRVIYGWLCTVSGAPGTWVEVGASTAVLAATQTEQETGTSTSVYATPGRQHFHASAVKGWLDLDTDTVRASYNVTSITDNGVGDHTVNWTTQFSSDNYAVAVGVGGDSGSTGSGAWTSRIVSKTAAAVRVTTQRPDTAVNVDSTDLNVVALGDL